MLLDHGCTIYKNRVTYCNGIHRHMVQLPNELARAGVVKSYEEGAQLAAYGRVHSDFEAYTQYANPTT